MTVLGKGAVTLVLAGRTCTSSTSTECLGLLVLFCRALFVD